MTERTQQLEAVRAIGIEITRELDLAVLLDLVIRRAAELSGVSIGMILLADAEGRNLTPKAWCGLGAWVEGVRFGPGEGLTGAVAARRQGMIENDYRASAYAHPQILEHTTMTAACVEPLIYRDRLLGVILLGDDSLGRPFNERDRETLGFIAVQAAVAIENARLFQESQQYGATLEVRVRERTRDLEAARLAAESASQVKSEFLANVTHELRTPLNGILGFSDLLLRQGQTLPPDKKERFLTHIHTSGQRLLELVERLLDYTAAETDTLALDCRPLAPAPVLEEVLLQIQPLATEKDQSLLVDIATDLPIVHADPARLRQMCFNLLGNAVKFTPPGGTITVVARIAKGVRPFDGSAVPEQPNSRTAEQPNALQSVMLEIAVTDTGMGIKAEDLPRLFQPFTQLESAYTKQHAGTGIGLALTKRLVELHGGTITAASDGEGQGSTFTVRLPVEQGE